MALPFQDIDAEIVGIKCHGWSKAGAAIMGTPDKTVERTSIENMPTAFANIIQLPSGHKYLFKMESSEFEGNGSGEKFSSAGSGSGIYFDYMNSDGDLKSEFTEIFNNYATVALETVVKVKVYYTTLNSGFRLGIAQL